MQIHIECLYHNVYGDATLQYSRCSTSNFKVYVDATLQCNKKLSQNKLYKVQHCNPIKILYQDAKILDATLKSNKSSITPSSFRPVKTRNLEQLLSTR